MNPLGNKRSRILLVLLGVSTLLVSGFVSGCGYKGAVRPNLASISPSTVAAGSPGFTLTATGAAFVSGTQVVLDGVPQTTTVVSSSQLTTSVSAAQIASPGTIIVGVLKPDSTSSNVLQLTVTGQTVSPKLISISPSSVASGSADFVLTAMGSNFVSGSLIALDGVGITTTFDSATQLHATVPASHVAVADTINVGVLDPANVLTNELPLTVTGTVTSPAPTLSSLSPASVLAGSAGTTLTATGTKFVTGCQVTWNGVAVPITTFVSSTQVQATIPASYFTTPTYANIAVLNPGNTVSNVVQFEVAVPPNTNPSLTSILPSRRPTGGPAFTMTLTGSNFAAGAVVKLSGQALPTTVVSQTQATAVVPSTDLLAVGQFPITITNPASQASNPIPFYVGITTFYAEIRDLIWDTTNKVFYLSIASDSPKFAQTVLAYDPVAGAIVHRYSPAVGSGPNRLAISDDQQFLYVGLDGGGAIQRLTLPSLQPDISIPLGSDPNLVSYAAIDIQVAPTLPHTIAVSRGIPSATIPAQGGVAIYDDATQRPTVVPSLTPPQNAAMGTLQWGVDATILYAADEQAKSDFYQLAVSATGVTLVSDNPGFFPIANSRIHFDRGNHLLYGDDGYIVDPVTATQLGNFGSSGAMVPDSTIGDAYFLGQPADQSGTGGYALNSFKLTTRSLISTLPLYSVQGVPQHLIRWGPNGLAFNTLKVGSCSLPSCSSGQLYILKGPFVTKTGP